MNIYGFAFSTILNYLEIPGDYQTDCDSSTSIDCGCGNEIWVFSECSNAFVCREEGSTQGEVISCPDGEIVDIDLSVPPFDIKCTDQVEKCPGESESTHKNAP